MPTRRRSRPEASPQALVRLSTTGGPWKGISASTVRARAARMLAHLSSEGHLAGAVELSIALVDDATIHELNRAFRKKDKPTDVLAFPMEEHPLAATASARRLLGDVIISLDTAGRQAHAHRRPLLDEVTMLLAHGLLHLLGFDHRNDREERVMNAHTKELEVVAKGRAGRTSAT